MHQRLVHFAQLLLMSVHQFVRFGALFLVEFEFLECALQRRLHHRTLSTGSAGAAGAAGTTRRTEAALWRTLPRRLIRRRLGGKIWNERGDAKHTGDSD